MKRDPAVQTPPTPATAATILGISALYHDSAACLVRNGEIVAAAQEERFTRQKHDASFPRQAIDYCLQAGESAPEQLDAVVFYEKPLLKFDRIIETALRYAPRGLSSFMAATAALINDKLAVPKLVDQALHDRYRGPVLFVEHHQAHAASAFLPSPFARAAIVTVDGVGEWCTTSIGLGEGARVALLRELHFPHSLGLLYSAFTWYAGFKINSGEYKLMGLAPYGQPRFAKLIRDELIDLRADGSFRLNMAYFDYGHRLRTVGERFCRLFGGPARDPEGELLPRFLDVAASIQVVTEEVMLGLAKEAHRLTGADDLCLAGGVALNCVANGRVLREGPFRRLWIQPAAGDAGGALGAALLVAHDRFGARRKGAPTVARADAQHGSLLGPSWTSATAAAELTSLGARFDVLDSEAALLREVVALLGAGKVVGWFQGRMEFGPRALGARSILADPRSFEMQSRVNLRIKFREGFRPFAPVVLSSRVQDYFDLAEESPYMLLVAPVAAAQRLPVPPNEGSAQGPLQRLHVQRSRIAAVTHVDYSARVQTCDAERNPRLHRLLEAWEQATGCAVLLNTSFNVRGEPIVCSPTDAWRCFLRTDMDALVVENALLRKEEQSQSKEDLHAPALPKD